MCGIVCFIDFKAIRKILKYSSYFFNDSSNIKRQLYRIGLNDNELIFDMLSIVFKLRELKKLAGPDLLEVLNIYTPKSIVDNHLKDLKTDSLIQKLRYVDIKLTLSEDMLVKIDRTSMVNSLETRAFFLHPKLLDLVFKFDHNLLVKKTTSKYILKKLLEKYIPKEILYRKKMGFSMPLNKWIFEDLNDVFEESIAYLPENLFSHDEIRRIIKLHKKGGRDFIMQLHALMFLGQWFKIHLKGF